MFNRCKKVDKVIYKFLLISIMLGTVLNLDLKIEGKKILHRRINSILPDPLEDHKGDNMIDLDTSIDKILAEVNSESTSSEKNKSAQKRSKGNKLKGKMLKGNGSMFKKHKVSPKNNKELKISQRKLTMMIMAVAFALLFWGVFVQWALDKSKRSTIELRVIEKQETMTQIEKMLYESKLKKKRKEWQERQGLKSD